MGKTTDTVRFRRFATIVLAIMTVITLLPLILVVIASFTEESSLVSNGYTFLPEKLSLDAYYYMIKQGSVIMRAYGVSFAATGIGTLISVLLTTMMAYPIS